MTHRRMKSVVPWAAALIFVGLGWLCIAGLPLFGDDWGYGLYLRDGIGAFVRRMVEHDRTVNGRTLVHVVDCLLLAGGEWPGRIALGVLWAGLSLLVAANGDLHSGRLLGKGLSDARGERETDSLTVPTVPAPGENGVLPSDAPLGRMVGERRDLPIRRPERSGAGPRATHSGSFAERWAVSAGLLWLLGLPILRETAFWITGGINYLLAADAFLLVLLLARNRGESHGCGIALIGASLVCALTMEQAAAGCVALLCLSLVGRLRRHRPWRAELIALLLALPAAATVFFAPGNQVRRSYYADFYALPLLRRTAENLNAFSRMALSEKGLLLPVGLVLLAAGTEALGKRRPLPMAAGAGMIASVALSAGFVLTVLWNGAFAALCGLPLTAGVCLLIGWEARQAIRQRAADRLIVLLLAAGLEAAMVLSPVMGGRISLLPGALCLVWLTDARRSFVSGGWLPAAAVVLTGVCLPVGRTLGLAVTGALAALLLVGRLLCRRRKRPLTALCLALAAAAMALPVTRGYLLNAPVHRENESRITEAAEAGALSVELLYPPAEDCRWTLPYDGSPWHGEVFRAYWGLDPDCEIRWSVGTNPGP